MTSWANAFLEKSIDKNRFYRLITEIVVACVDILNCASRILQYWRYWVLVE